MQGDGPEMAHVTAKRTSLAQTVITHIIKVVNTLTKWLWGGIRGSIAERKKEKHILGHNQWYLTHHSQSKAPLTLPTSYSIGADLDSTVL